MVAGEPSSTRVAIDYGAFDDNELAIQHNISMITPIIKWQDISLSGLIFTPLWFDHENTS